MNKPNKPNKPNKIFIIGVTGNQFIYTLICNYMPNIRILAKEVLQILNHIGPRVQEELAFKQIIHDFLFLALAAILFIGAQPF